MGITFRYPIAGEPDIVHFDITGKRPSQEEAAKLTSIPIEKRPVSAEEAKEALTWLTFGVLAGIAAWFFGRWVIGNFKGPGVLFFGYGFAYIGAPALLIFAVVSLFKLFRSAQKKKPEDALKWIYMVSFLGDDTVGARFGKPNYAVATLNRIIPDAIGFNSGAAHSYITNFRNTLIRAMEITTAPVRNEPPKDWKEGFAQTIMRIDGTQELYPGVSEVRATLTYKDILTRSDGNNNTVNVIAAIIELHINNVLIRSGKYWYPYDIFPAVTCRRELPELRPEGEAASAELNK